MKISNNTPNYISQTYTNQQNSAASQNQKNPPASEELPSDSINLSNRTRDLQKVSKALENPPPERRQYVADIKQKVENNQYNVNAEAVAEKIVGMLMDDFG